jgi:ABC-type multidrug transport system ATPase subunit
MLELRHVTKRFSGIPAVDDVSFSARPGEATAYLGPNGSGKSTTTRLRGERHAAGLFSGGRSGTAGCYSSRTAV